MEPTKLISLLEFQQVRYIAARIATVKFNKTARVPAYLCSLDVGAALLEVHLSTPSWTDLVYTA